MGYAFDLDLVFIMIAGSGRYGWQRSIDNLTFYNTSWSAFDSFMITSFTALVVV